MTKSSLPTTMSAQPALRHPETGKPIAFGVGHVDPESESSSLALQDVSLDTGTAEAPNEFSAI